MSKPRKPRLQSEPGRSVQIHRNPNPMSIRGVKLQAKESIPRLEMVVNSVTASTTNATSSIQLQMQQFRLQQARQDAARADSEVRSLESQTQEARRNATNSRSNVEKLEQNYREDSTRLNTQGQVTGRLINTQA